MGHTQSAVPGGTIYTRLIHVSQVAPEALALLGPDQLPATYRDLLLKVRNVAGAVASLAVGAGDKVATVVPDSPEMGVLFLGCASVATCAPLNPRYRSSDFEFYLSDLKPKFVVVDADLDSPVRNVANSLGIRVVELRRNSHAKAGCFELESTVSSAEIKLADANDIALVLHTSGTTSRPKMVPISHANLMASVANITRSLALTPADRCLNIMPLFHVHGLIGAVLSSLYAGASVVCTPGFQAPLFLQWLKEFHPTWYSGVPTMHRAILDRAKETPDQASRNSLRFIRSCSAALAPDTMRELESTFGVPVVEAYGMTEASHQMAINPLPPAVRKAGSVGVPTGVQIAIMNEAGELLPTGTEGEIVIQGPNVVSGYEHNPEANKKSFTNGWFRTGDQGRLDSDGYLFITGRIKELIVRGGEKISPREIDELLLTHPAVAQALAFAIPDDKLGEEVGAAVVLKPGQSVNELELREHVARKTADFKVPRKIVCVDKLPTGPTGKQQRIGLAAILGLDKPSETQPTSSEFVAPRGDVERSLAELWSAVLHRANPSVNEDFFAVGGDSILAAQLIGRIRKTFGVEISIPRLFSLPTIAQLAEWLSSQKAAPISPGATITKTARSAGIPLSFPQKRMWFAAQYAGETPVYNRSFALRLKGPLDLFRVQQSLTAVLERHEILRTNYVPRDSMPVQIVGSVRPVPISLVDLSREPDSGRMLAVEKWAREETAKPFNLATDLMLRAGLAKVGTDDHILLFISHHIAFDATSQASFLRDLTAAYNGSLKAALADELDYPDFAAWQERQPAAEFERLFQWWKGELAGLSQLNTLPGDFERPPQQTYRGGTVDLAIESELTSRIAALGKALGVTPFMILLAAFNALAFRYSGCGDSVVGTPTAGRGMAETEEMIGLFVNLLVLRTKVSSDCTFRELIQCARTTTMNALEHQELPFEKLVEGLAPERSLSHSPLFQVMFEYRNHAVAELNLAGVSAQPFEFESGYSQYDLHLDIRPGDSETTCLLHYSSDLFQRESAQRILQDYVSVLASGLKNPDLTVAELSCSANAQQVRAKVEPAEASRVQSGTADRRGENGMGERSPLSFAQERLWFLHQFEPESTAYNAAILLEVRGALNLDALRRSIEFVVARHEALRTTFHAKDGLPTQIVQAPPRIHLPLFDLNSQPKDEKEKEIERIKVAEFYRTFNLESDLMLRAIVIRLEPELHQVLFTLDHIATDGWSNDLLLKELGLCYSAFVQGRSPELPDLPLQYPDFAAWQRQTLTDESLQEHLEYWKMALADIPTGPQLLTDFPRPSKQTYSGGYLSVPVQDDLRDALNEFSRKERATLFMTVLAAFGVLLHRYTDQPTVVIGTPVANRDRIEIESLIGFFVNTLALRCDFTGDPTFRELLLRVRETTLGAYAHQELPFEKLVQALRPERSLSHSPIFQTLLAVQNTPSEPLSFSGLSATREIFERESAQFDLSTFVEFTPHLRIAYSYNTDLFARGTIARLAEHFENLLRSAIANPDTRISRLPIVSETESKQLLAWGEKKRPYPNRCIHEIFEEVAARTPEKVALVQGTQSLTFAELNQRANRLAHDFAKAGVRPGHRIGLLFQRSIDVIVGMLAALKVGAAFVPIDPAYPKTRIDFIVNDCGIRVVFTNTNLIERIPQSCAAFKAEDYRADGVPAPNLGLQVSPDAAAYVIFTSGSTGIPKGVEVPHRGIVRLVFSQDYARFGPEQTTLQLCSLSFDVSQFEIWASLLHGATCVIFSGQQIDAENIGKDIRDHGVVSMWLTTSLFNTVMEESPAVLAPVKQLLIGGEALSVPHIHKALEALPGTQLIDGYGPTENSVFSNCHYIPRDIPKNLRSIPIGAPIANTSAFILDRNFQPVPIGIPGELCVGGDGLAIGYLNRPELNSAAFIQNPVPGALDRRLYKTGDLCRWLPDGTVEYLGRGDGQVKVRGFRVELGEVENAIKQHRSVKHVVATVWGEGSDRRLVGYVVLDDADSLRGADLKEYLRKTLPEYMVPSQFVFLPRLPLLESGKVNKKALPAPILSDFEVAAPADSLEEQLKNIWEEALGRTSIGVNQDFFDLGGHSLLATKLLARVQRSLGVKLPIASLFQAPTISEFAKLVRQKSQLFPPAVQKKRSVPPLFWVGGGVFLKVVSSWLQPEREVIPMGLDMDEWLSLQKPYKVEDMARIIARHIVAQNPEGPYYLGGWCYEGVLAYETALQLIRGNRSVDLLVLVDAVTPQSRISMSKYDRIAARFHREVFHLRNLLRLGPAKWSKYLRDRFEDFIEYRKRTHWQKNSNVTGPTFEDERNRVLHLAMLNYLPSVYEGNLLFCQAANRPAGAYWDLASEWRSLVKGKAEFLEIGGDHVSMLKPPNVDLFATKLKLALDAAPENRQTTPAVVSHA